MTTAPQGPGWWMANDGRWYPPNEVSAAAGRLRTGVTTFTGRFSVDPGDTLSVDGLVIITNNGAANVTSVTAQC